MLVRDLLVFVTSRDRFLVLPSVFILFSAVELFFNRQSPRDLCVLQGLIASPH